MSRFPTVLTALMLTLLPLTAQAQDEADGSDTAASAKTVTVGLNKDANGPGGRNITAFDRPGQRGIGGYFAQELTADNLGNVFFDQRQLVLQVSSYLHENIFFNAEIEYEHGGNVAKGGEIALEQAWGEYTVNEGLNLRAGILLIPLGRLNVFHDADFREATTRPLVTQQIIPSTWYEPGIGARGVFTPTDTMEVTYEAYLTQGLSSQIDATGTISARPQQGIDNNAGKAISGRVAVSPWLGTEIGLGGYVTPYDDANGKWLGMGTLDLLWRLGAFELVGEGTLLGTQGGTFQRNNASVTTPYNMGGYYLEGHYSFFPDAWRESFLGKGLGFTDPRFTAFARWGQIDTDFSQLTADDRAEAVLGLNYRPVPNAALKVEWQRQMRWVGTTTDAFISSLAMGF